MEYVRGRTLRDVLAERRRLNPVEALAICEQMLAAIAAAHRAGLVHRDVKPENVLVAEAPSGGVANLVDSVVKVADFGLARAVEASADDEHGSQLMATVAYVAPELVTEGRADPRTDVYSAGIVLFEMLTGRVPYDGDRAGRRRLAARRPGRAAALDAGAAACRRSSTTWCRGPPGAIPAPGPTDAGALLAEVQVARDDLGDANSHTAVLRPVATRPPLAQPTMMVADGPSRPTARPGPGCPTGRQQPGPGRASGRRRSRRTAWAARLAALRSTVLSNPRGRLAVAAVVVTLGLVAALGGWWFGVGRYTEAPQLVSLTKAEAQAQADRAGLHRHVRRAALRREGRQGHRAGARSPARPAGSSRAARSP